MKKNKFSNIKKIGFTLIEMLLVIAIIGILAGVIMVGINGQREKAKRTRALESVRSVMPYLVDCYLRNDTIASYNSSGSTKICPSTSVVYPNVLNDVCTSASVSSGYFNVDCGDSNIVCSYGASGNCEVR